MNKLLSFSYYFTPKPDPDFQYTTCTLLFILLLLLIGVAIRIYRKKYCKDAIVKKMVKRYPGRLLIFGSVLLFLLMLREAGLPYLSMRIWWFLFAFIFIYWVVKTLLGFKKEYRKRSQKAHLNAKKAKWIPRRKKR